MRFISLIVLLFRYKVSQFLLFPLSIGQTVLSVDFSSNLCVLEKLFRFLKDPIFCWNVADFKNVI
jgi:hypothetical protein